MQHILWLTLCVYVLFICRPGNTLYLEGEGRGIVNNMCFPSEVARSYAPAGQVRRSACSARAGRLWNPRVVKQLGGWHVLPCWRTGPCCECTCSWAVARLGQSPCSGTGWPLPGVVFKHGCYQRDGRYLELFSSMVVTNGMAEHGCYQWDGRCLEYSLEVAPSAPLVQTLVSVSTIGTLDELSEQQLIDTVKQVGCAAARETPW